MDVTIRLHQASEPMFFTNIKNTYTKGPLFCMRLPSNETMKYPLASIFSIKEGNAYTTTAYTTEEIQEVAK